MRQLQPAPRERRRRLGGPQIGRRRMKFVLPKAKPILLRSHPRKNRRVPPGFPCTEPRSVLPELFSPLGRGRITGEKNARLHSRGRRCPENLGDYV